MARFSSITCGIFVLTGAVTLLQAQTMRPMPVQRPHSAREPGSPNASTNSAPTIANRRASPGSSPSRSAKPNGAGGAPVVTYRDGLLSVQALNSSLSSVVTAIRNKTGIEFEGAEGISERVAIALGPAPEGDVLSAIFAGSKYDFLAIGRADSPSIVQKVILTVKNAPGAGAGTEAQAQRPAANQGEEEEVPDEQINNGGDPQDTPAQPVPIFSSSQAETQNQQPEVAGTVAAGIAGNASAKGFAGGAQPTIPIRLRKIAAKLEINRALAFKNLLASPHEKAVREKWNIWSAFYCPWRQ